jgi:transmembrane 9 superfamily protein 3
MFCFTGKVWIKQMLMSTFLLPSLVCGTAFFINFIAIYYHASRAIPFGTMVIILKALFLGGQRGRLKLL